MKQELSYYRKRIIVGMIIFGILALGVIPIFTIYMGVQKDPFTITFSEMGNLSASRHLLFILWTVLFSASFASFVGYLLMLTRNTQSKIRKFVSFATIILILGNIFPFVPDLLPKLAGLHNIFVQTSSICLAVILMLFTLTLKATYSMLFKKALTFVLCIWMTMIVLIIAFGPASITTMTGTIVAGVFLFTVLVWLYQEDKFDPVQSLKEKDALHAREDAEKLWKRAEHALEEYLKLEAAARRASLEADEVERISKYKR